MADSDSTTGKPPAFQFYPKDFLTGTLTFSTEEVGAYILLMCHCWDKGSLPSDLTLRARIARLSPAKMRRAWVALGSKFEPVETGYIQPRLERERVKQAQYRQRQAEASRKRWDTQATPKPIPSGMPNASSPSPSPVSSFQSSDCSQKTTDARSKRPIFKGQRFVVFEWMLDDLARMLGPHTEAFDLHAWFYDLDAELGRSGFVVPQRDGGKWLQERAHDEAVKRGLPLAPTVTNNPKTVGNLAAAARFIARG